MILSVTIFSEVPAVEILKFRLGDILELKKTHPCGGRQFRVLRMGSEVRIVCCSCGRDLIMDRIKLERAVKRVIPAPDSTPETAE